MSSEEDFVESIVDSDSEFEIDSPSPVKKKKAAPKKTKEAAPKKVAGAKKSKPKRKVLKEINNLDSDFDDDSEPEVKTKGRNSMEKAALSSRFQKKNQLEHILLRADVYIGSPDKTECESWVYDSNTKSLAFKKIEYSPGLFKIVDEILVNAADNKQRDPTMKSIKVTIDKESGIISVRNDGKGIPIEMHQEHNVYIPELIFGHLLTGENFEDTKKRVVGGKNGYGAKLANIFSQWFEIETVDSKSGFKYVQRWTTNMTVCGKAKITKCSSKTKDYTMISFLPDFKRFQSEKLEDDTYDLLCRRVYDIAGVTHLSLKVHLNGEKLQVDRFDKYVDMYLKALKNGECSKKGKASKAGGSKSETKDKSSSDEDEDSSNDEMEEDKVEDTTFKIYQKVNPYWEICIAASGGSFGHVSFVNSISTHRGGKHVDYVTDMVVKVIADKLASDRSMKGANLKPAQIKNNIFIFVNCLIVNPTFDSQSKEYLATKSNKFGDKENLPVLSPAIQKSLLKSDIIESIKNLVVASNMAKFAKKTKGKKTGRLIIEKLDDANKANSKEWKKCTLILTEGDSAKSLAVSGLSKVGREYYGVFPLKGKLLNVRDATPKQILGNSEIQNICKILGLVPGQHVDTSMFRGKSKNKLRYGHVMIMTDQDHDGSHIKGLLFNFFHYYWPELMKEISTFVQVFITPIVKCTKKTGKNPEVLSFYTMPEYVNWCNDSNTKLSQYQVKYYKGLGTSTAKEAKEYFKDIDKNRIKMLWDRADDSSGDSIKMAFSKKLANERKKWLSDYNETYGAADAIDGFVDFSSAKLTYSTFVNKELVQFSLADNIRSIPSMVDGFKPSQRKVIFAIFKKLLSKSDFSTTEVKVSQFAGYAAGVSAYHHGEASLLGTIVSLAQNYVGSNNINLLRPEGQFGTRLLGGKDCASGRYIFTGVTPLLTKIYRKEDECILNYLQEEGKRIEPEYYLPILPMALINGAQGIGTGWSTEVPMFNPKDIVRWLKHRINREEGKADGNEMLKPLHPWIRGFKGSLIRSKDSQYISRGISELSEDPYKGTFNLKIDELPVGKWTNDYKAFLDKMYDEDNAKQTGTNDVQPGIKNVSNNSTEETVNFTVELGDQLYKELLDKPKHLIKTFSLEKTMSTTNMHLFDENHKIKKFETPRDILDSFFKVRLEKYKLRKTTTVKIMEASLRRLSNEERFVTEVANGVISITKRKKAELESELKKRGFDMLPEKASSGISDDNEEQDENNEKAQGVSYAYLLKIPILSLTMEKVNKLKSKREESEKELEIYRGTTVYEFWRRELDIFLEEYELFLVETNCAGTGQKTVIPENFKKKQSILPVAGQQSLDSPSEDSPVEEIEDLSNELDKNCEVTPKPDRIMGKKTKAKHTTSRVTKKLKLTPEEEKKKPKKKSKMVVLDDSDISDISDFDDDELKELDEPVETVIPTKDVKKSKKQKAPTKAKVTKKPQAKPKLKKKESSEIDSDISNFTLSSDEGEMSVEEKEVAPVEVKKTKKAATPPKRAKRAAAVVTKPSAYQFSDSDSEEEVSEDDSEYSEDE